MFNSFFNKIQFFANKSAISGNDSELRIISDDEKRLQLAAEAIVEAILGWPVWVYRRVDSVHPMEGARGRLKHSIDCVPPPETHLAYDENERELSGIDDVRGQIMLPLAFIKKGPMRHLDVRQNDDTTIPVLNSKETTKIMSAALVLLLQEDGVPYSLELKTAMDDLMISKGNGNLERARNLINTGKWEGKDVWSSGVVQLRRSTSDMLLNLSTDFVLIGLYPASKSGTRQVLKFSYHWVVSLPNRRIFQRIRDNWLVAFRYRAMEFDVPMHMPAATKSYHLEFHVPPELDIRVLSLPPSLEADENLTESMVDNSGTPVAHVHMETTKVVEKGATVKLSVPTRGIWMAALMASCLTAGVFLLALLLPNAMETLRGVGGNAAALMLAVPAVFIGFLAFPREHIFSSAMLAPLRIVVGICALLLFMMAGSLVGGLDQPFLSMLWCLGALFSTFFAVALLCGSLSSHCSTRKVGS